jgi:AAA family ATP:ADP antiporter
VANTVLPHGIAQVTRDGIAPSFIGAAEQLQRHLGVDAVDVERVPSPTKSHRMDANDSSPEVLATGATSATSAAPSPPTPTTIQRALAQLLRPFAHIEPEETVGAVVLAAIVFLLLTAYYLLKTAREPLILLHGGAEVKSYASAGQAALLVVVVRAYSSVAKRFGRVRLLGVVYLFFASNLVVFAALAAANVAIGVPFFLWVGVFNYTSIAQFWAFAADSYTPEKGKRVFVVLGIGSSLGAVVGARIARDLISLGPQALMIVAAVILTGCVGLLAWVDRFLSVPGTGAASRTVGARAVTDPERSAPLAGDTPFGLLRRDRYLLLIAGLTLVLNWVNATGEYILDRSLLATVHDNGLHGPAASAFIGAFKAQYFAWINGVGILLQLFAVSRILTRLGVKNALLFQPAVSLVGYALVAFSPMLSLIRLVKVGENSIAYSLQNTARQALYLVTSRVEKYVGKTTVDTLFVRLGDVLSACVVAGGVLIAASPRVFAALNVVLVSAWVVLVFAVGRENSRRTGEGEERIALEPLPS